MFTVTPVTTNLMVLSFLSQKANSLPMDGLAFCKSMLIVPNHLLFQAARMLLECLNVSKGLAVWSSKNQKMTNFSLDFEDCFKDGCNICLFPDTCNLP